MVAAVPINGKDEVAEKGAGIDGRIEEDADFWWYEGADNEDDEGNNKPDASGDTIAIEAHKMGELGAAKDQNAGGSGIIGSEDEVGSKSTKEGELDEAVALELNQDKEDAEKDAGEFDDANDERIGEN